MVGASLFGSKASPRSLADRMLKLEQDLADLSVRDGGVASDLLDRMSALSAEVANLSRALAQRVTAVEAHIDASNRAVAENEKRLSDLIDSLAQERSDPIAPFDDRISAIEEAVEATAELIRKAEGVDRLLTDQSAHAADQLAGLKEALAANSAALERALADRETRVPEQLAHIERLVSDRIADLTVKIEGVDWMLADLTARTSEKVAGVEKQAEGLAAEASARHATVDNELKALSRAVAAAGASMDQALADRDASVTEQIGRVERLLTDRIADLTVKAEGVDWTLADLAARTAERLTGLDNDVAARFAEMAARHLAAERDLRDLVAALSGKVDGIGEALAERHARASERIAAVERQIEEATAGLSIKTEGIDWTVADLAARASERLAGLETLIAGKTLETQARQAAVEQKLRDLSTTTADAAATLSGRLDTLLHDLALTSREVLQARLKSLGSAVTESSYLVESQLADLNEQLTRQSALLGSLFRQQTIYLGDHLALTQLHTGQKIYLDTRDTALCSQLMLRGRGDLWLERAFLDLLAPGMTFVDIGAGYGYCTLLAGSIVGPTGRVFAFEADPPVAGLLLRSLLLNGFDAWTTVIDKTRYSGAVRLGGDGEASPRGASGGDPGSPAEQSRQPVDAFAMDDVVPRDVSIDVVRIARQSAGPDVIQGMSHVLQRSPSITLFMEVTEAATARAGDPLGFLSACRAAGFSLQLVGADGVSQTVEPPALLDRAAGWSGYILMRREAPATPRKRTQPRSKR